MSDSMTDNLLNRGAPRMSLCDLPAEMLQSICSHANLVSLMRLSATCSAIRAQVHKIFTSRISTQAMKYPEVKQSLDRLGWEKEHNFWDCKCFKLIAGPGFTLSHLQEHSSFSVVCNYLFFARSSASASAAGKLFFVPSTREISFRQMAPGGDLGQSCQRTLIKFNNIVFNATLATFDNVLVVYFKHSSPHLSGMVYVFNANTLVKVSEMDLCRDEDGEFVMIRAISLSRGTMVIHLDYIIHAERDTKIQVWKLSTKDPQKEEISLLYTMSHDNAMLSRQIRPSCHSVCVNDRFIVIVDTVVKVFVRSEKNLLVRQIGIANKTLSRMALQGDQGNHLALLLKYFDDDGVRVTVNVYSASGEDLIVQKEFNPILSWNSPFYMTWFGDHLIVGSQEENTLSLFTWQPGLTSFLNSPFQVPVVRRSPRANSGHSTAWIANCLTVDYQGLVTAIYDQRESDRSCEKMVFFKTWKSSS